MSAKPTAFPKSYAANCSGQRGSKCPACSALLLYCIDSRPTQKHGRRRRHACMGCWHRETTYEITEARMPELEDAERLLKTLTGAMSELRR